MSEGKQLAIRGCSATVGGTVFKYVSASAAAKAYPRHPVMAHIIPFLNIDSKRKKGKESSWSGHLHGVKKGAESNVNLPTQT